MTRHTIRTLAVLTAAALVVGTVGAAATAATPTSPSTSPSATRPSTTTPAAVPGGAAAGRAGSPARPVEATPRQGRPIASSAAPGATAKGGCQPVPGGGSLQVVCQSVPAPQPTGRRAAAATIPGYTPADLHSAYAIPTAKTTATVAVTVAGRYPNLERDLTQYRRHYGLGDCTVANHCLRIVDQNGHASTATTPRYLDKGWISETALDVDMVSAICRTCHILVVQASSPDLNGRLDLEAAVRRAVAMGAKYVNMSWLRPERSTDPQVDSTFKTLGVAYVAAAGDHGYGSNYPASSPYVTAAGGTSLTKDAKGRWQQTAWRSSTGSTGAGCSRYEGKPVWQTVVAKDVCPNRAATDVSMVANPDTGVSIYVSCGDTTKCKGWEQYGGTSASSPMIAALYAMAGTPRAGSYAAYYPYANLNSGNHTDITTGNNNTNGNCYVRTMCYGVPGWDGPTGLGTPRGLGMFVTPPASVISLAALKSRTGYAGDAVSIGYRGHDSRPLPLYWSLTGIPYGLRFTGGAGYLKGRLTTGGRYKVAAVARDVNGGLAKRTFTWTVRYHHLRPAGPLRVSGSYKVGRTLKASYTTTSYRIDRSNGRKTRAAVKYRWYANGRKIPHATHRTYKIPSKYRHKTIHVLVIATHDYYYGWNAYTGDRTVR